MGTYAGERLRRLPFVIEKVEPRAARPRR